MSGTRWVKSGHSDKQGGNCVEWAPGLVSVVGAVCVRDGKDRGRGTLGFSTGAWAAFVGGVQRG
ncbi:DUF397 domain-containing protein [Streptomyces sp. NRRL F-5053]|uniref:DUF397 domain-containing protein n=1 Tax=Streptomyces sp. NRRL F-5053 TaxID=1463854 RepID=UPI00099C837B|nr:DUF397 domain-containing protein [Streptomyces sp. NRRL F-5053]